MNETTNTELVKICYELFKRGDIEQLLNLLADDVKWEMPVIESVPFLGIRHGREEVAGFFSQLDEYEEVTLFEPREFIAQGDRVVCLGKYGARVKETNRSYEVDWVQLFTVLDGKVTSFLEFYDTAVVERAFSKATAA